MSEIQSKNENFYKEVGAKKHYVKHGLPKIEQKSSPEM